MNMKRITSSENCDKGVCTKLFEKGERVGVDDWFVRKMIEQLRTR